MTSLLRYCILGALLIPLAMAAGGEDLWDYSAGKYGPENWGTLVPKDCGGTANSPIDLVYRNTVKTSYPPFTFTGYGTVPADANLTMFNNGFSLGVNFDSASNAYRVGGGGLASSNYRLAQFHFHWSSLDDLNSGSEHVLNGELYPAEVHFVHWNADQHTDLVDAAFSNASTTSSLAVLGWFIEVCDIDNPAFEPLLKYVANVSQGGTDAKYHSADRFTLDSLLPASRGNFFRYQGGLTTPPCSEVVTWTVFKEPITISRKQLKQFINSTYFSPLPNQTKRDKMEGNYRPPQPLNGRTVFRTFDDKNLYVAPPPPPKAPGSSSLRLLPELLVFALAALAAAILK